MFFARIQGEADEAVAYSVLRERAEAETVVCEDLL